MVASSRLDIVNLIEWMDGLRDMKKFQHIKKEVVLELKMEMLDKAMEKRDVSEGEYMWWCEILKKEFESVKKPFDGETVVSGGGGGLEVVRRGISIVAPPEVRMAWFAERGIRTRERVNAMVEIRVDEALVNGELVLLDPLRRLVYDINPPHNIIGDMFQSDD